MIDFWKTLVVVILSLSLSVAAQGSSSVKSQQFPANPFLMPVETERAAVDLVVAVAWQDLKQMMEAEPQITVNPEQARSYFKKAARAFVKTQFFAKILLYPLGSFLAKHPDVIVAKALYWGTRNAIVYPFLVSTGSYVLMAAVPFIPDVEIFAYKYYRLKRLITDGFFRKEYGYSRVELERFLTELPNEARTERLQLQMFENHHQRYHLVIRSMSILESLGLYSEAPSKHMIIQRDLESRISDREWLTQLHQMHLPKPLLIKALVDRVAQSPEGREWLISRALGENSNGLPRDFLISIFNTIKKYEMAMSIYPYSFNPLKIFTWPLSRRVRTRFRQHNKVVKKLRALEKSFFEILADYRGQGKKSLSVYKSQIQQLRQELDEELRGYQQLIKVIRPGSTISCRPVGA